MEFRPRDYIAEKEAHSLPRVRADDHHPLSVSPSSDHQIDITDCDVDDFFDPLKGPDTRATTANDVLDVDDMSSVGFSSGKTPNQLPPKEWSSFNRFLMQSFPVSNTISISSKSLSSIHIEELEDPQKFAEEGVKVIIRQEYVTRLQEPKDEITRAHCVQAKHLAHKDKEELTVVGGTGSFAFARGLAIFAQTNQQPSDEDATYHVKLQLRFTNRSQTIPG